MADILQAQISTHRKTKAAPKKPEVLEEMVRKEIVSYLSEPFVYMNVYSNDEAYIEKAYHAARIKAFAGISASLAEFAEEDLLLAEKLEDILLLCQENLFQMNQYDW